MVIDSEYLGMKKTKLIAIFLFSMWFVNTDNASLGEEANNEFYLDIAVQEADKSFTSLSVGPCRWSVLGKQFDNSLLRVRNLQLLDNIQPSKDPGYRVALRCQDLTAKAFDVQLGFGKGVSPAQILESQEAFQGIIDDTTVFLAFRYNIGSKR
jgi:hypothetical protein